MEQLYKTVPNFLTKLWVLVDDAVLDHVIHWSKDGHSFEIVNEEDFCKEILPKYFKHNKISSFIRQLNMYGFRKVIAPQGEKTSEKKLSLEFQHPLFKKGGACLLGNIKRKVSTIKNEDTSLYSNEFQKILTEMQEIRNIQSNMDARYAQMKQDYSDLCLEITNLRKKYCEQQQLLTQILQCILDLISGNHTGLKKRKRSLSFIPGASDSEWDHQYSHIPDDKKKEAMEIVKDGYELVEDKCKSLLDRVLPILKESKNLISSVDQPSGDDGKDPNMPVPDIPMNEESLTIQLDLTIPFFKEQITEECFVQDPKDFSLELELSPLDSILIAEQSDTLCNSIMNRNKMHHTEGNLVELNSLLSRKAVNYDFDHFSESACYELPVLMANKSKNLLNMDIVVETNSVSLMENKGERSLLEASGEKDKHVKQRMEKPQLLLLDGTPICDFGENLQDSNDLLLDNLKKPSNVLSALCDHDYVAFNISTTQEDTANTTENIVPQLSAKASEEASAFSFRFLNPVTNSF